MWYFNRQRYKRCNKLEKCRGRAYRDTKRLRSANRSSDRETGTRHENRKSRLEANQFVANIRTKNPNALACGSMSRNVTVGNVIIMIIQKIVSYTSVLMMLFLVCITGCEKIPTMRDMTAPEIIGRADTIPIGVIVSLTGKDAEPYGLPMRRGLELAFGEINSEIGPRALRLRFIIVDNKSTEAGTIDAVQKLVDRDVPVIVGIAISDYLEDAFPIAQAAGVIAFSPTSAAAGLSSIGDYVFRAGLATNILIRRGVAVTQRELSYTKVALIYDADDTYSVSGNTELKKVLEANGVEIVMEHPFQTQDTDFRSQLTAIKDASVDAIFISALAPEMSQIMVQGRAVGIPNTVPFIIPELSNAVVQTVGAAAEGAITFASWDAAANTPGNTTFVQNYRDRYDREPEPWAAQSYATLYILAEAINKTLIRILIAPDLDDPDAYDKWASVSSWDAATIRDVLAETQDFPTILGDFSFDPNGEAIYDPIVLIVKNGVLEVFE